MTALRIILILLLVALILRLINLNQSLWLDEAIVTVAVSKYSFWDFVTKYSMGDFHPPGYFAILWIWIKAFGATEISVRLPSVIFGVITVYLTYLIAQKVISIKMPLISGLFMTLSPLHIFYSQEARMYSLAALSATLSTFLLLKIEDKSKKMFIFYVFSVILVLYSDYVTYFILPVHFMWILYFKKKLMYKFLLAIFLAFIFYLPWLLLLPLQLETGYKTSNIVSGWANVVGSSGVKETLLLPVKMLIGRISFDNKLMYISSVTLVGLIAILGFFKSIYKTTPELRLIFFWLIIPPLIGWLVSLFLPIFSYFRFIYILPAFYILLTYGFCSYSKRTSRILILFFTIAEVTFLSTYLFNPKFHREDWRQAVSYVEENADKQIIVLHKNNVITYPYLYYQKNPQLASSALVNYPAKNDSDLVPLNKILENIEKIYLFDYLKDITDPQDLVEKQIGLQGFSKKGQLNFRGVGFIFLYQKD